ncbi:MAG: hypothetical protein DDT22_01266 [candidate division WS2 bacterium]|nr:hypothetical protein [Candidatus Lithacetigena glycinireducens]
MDAFHILAMESETFERESFAGLAQKTHHRLFAEEGGEDGDAEGNPVGLGLHLEAAVLRQAFLVELEVGEHLDARDDARGGGLRQIHRIVEDAVDTIPHQHLGLHRLDMNVGRVLYDGVPQERVDDAHYWQVFGHFLKVVAGEVFASFCDDADLPRLGRDDVSEFVFERLLILQERIFDALGVGQARQYLESRLLAHRIDGGEILDIEHRHLERVDSFFVRDDIVRARDRLRDKREHIRRNAIILQIYKRNAEHIRLNASQRVFGQGAARHEDVAERLPALLRLARRLVNFFLGDEARVGNELLQLAF